MKYSYILLFICFSCFSSLSSNACEEPAPGMLLSKEELIAYSSQVYLVKLIREEVNSNGHQVVFKVLETIKGEEKVLHYYSSCDLGEQRKYDTITFNNHTDKDFWDRKKGGRCDFPCCVCMPYHTFKVGDTYLLFPEYYGSALHRERIASIKDDKWLQHVRNVFNKSK